MLWGSLLASETVGVFPILIDILPMRISIGFICIDILPMVMGGIDGIGAVDGIGDGMGDIDGIGDMGVK